MEFKYQSNPFCYWNFLILVKSVANEEQSKTITKKQNKNQLHISNQGKNRPLKLRKNSPLQCV